MTTTPEALATHEAEHHHHVTVIVFVNRKPVVFHEQKATGKHIKHKAIEQGVPIEQDFSLFLIKEHHELEPIGDDQEVKLHEQQKFRATACDDQS